MTKIVAITLENEMDLVLAHRRSMLVAEKLGLTVSTQTTFATAVSEVARSVIEHTNQGVLEIGIEQYKSRYALTAMVNFDAGIRFSNADTGFYYAQKLVPEFNLTEDQSGSSIQMKIGLPKSLRLDKVSINVLKEYFDRLQPLNAYEDLKQRNISLNKIAGEQELELRQSKLIDEKKTEFISIASHEIKTPMTVLKAYTQLAKTLKEPVSDRLKGLLDKIDVQSTKLMVLVQQLLDISRIENGNLQYSMKRLAFNNFLTNQVLVMQHILPHHELQLTAGPDAEVMIDELRLEQVFSNLLGNAAKYSANNTSIRVNTAVTGNGFITIAIQDNGMGISKENLTAIFGKFYRSEDVLTTHSGLGMGLYVTSKIVSDHGGKIWAESTPGVGSTFFFTLPLAVA